MTKMKDPTNKNNCWVHKGPIIFGINSIIHRKKVVQFVWFDHRSSFWLIHQFSLFPIWWREKKHMWILCSFLKFLISSIMWIFFNHFYQNHRKFLIIHKCCITFSSNEFKKLRDDFNVSTLCIYHDSKCSFSWMYRNII